MSNILKEIEQLNKKIDSLNTEKTRSDAQREVWEKRLKDGIKSYNEKYGTSLKLDSIKNIKGSLAYEMKYVAEKTKEEFEKSSKIVSAIESGNIDEAWSLLGVHHEETEEVEEEHVKDEGLQSVGEAMSDIDDSVFLGSGGSLAEDDEVIVKKEPEISVQPKQTFKNTFLVEEDDDEEDEFVIHNTSSKNSSKESDGVVTPKKNLFVDEDDSDDDPFGGFSSILQGTPFNPNN